MWRITGHRKQSLAVPCHRVQPRRSAGLPEKGRRQGTPVTGRLERRGILPLRQLAAWHWGPLPLVRSRFASLHPHRLLTCSHRRFPSLGFELPAVTNRCRPRPLGPAALGRAAPPWGEGSAPAGREPEETAALPRGAGRYRQGSSSFSPSVPQPCGPPRPPLKAPLSRYSPCSAALRCLLRVRFSRLCESPQLPAGGRQS